MGPQPILYIQIGYMFIICTVLVGWDHWLYYTYILCEYPQYIVCYLHGTTAYITDGDGVYVRYMHCVSLMGPLAILYMVIGFIFIICNVFVTWDHWLFYIYILDEYL